MPSTPVGRSDCNRRRFAGVVLGLAAGILLPRQAFALIDPLPRGLGPHPEPRPGITAAKMVPRDRIKDSRVRAIFDKVRQIPEVVDGIRCNCGCADLPGYRSLLTCYEEGMAQSCVICQGQGELAYRLHQEGWSLDGVRRAIDAKYGQ